MAIKKENGEYIDGKEFGELFMKWVNDMSLDTQGFAEVVTNDHATLQQTAFKVMMECIKKWSEKEYYDLRNEGTVLASKKIMEQFDNVGPALPFV